MLPLLILERYIFWRMFLNLLRLWRVLSRSFLIVNFGVSSVLTYHIVMLFLKNYVASDIITFIPMSTIKYLKVVSYMMRGILPQFVISYRLSNLKYEARWFECLHGYQKLLVFMNLGFKTCERHEHVFKFVRPLSPGKNDVTSSSIWRTFKFTVDLTLKFLDQRYSFIFSIPASH